MRRFEWTEIREGKAEGIPELYGGFDPSLPSYTQEYELISFYENAENKGVYQVSISFQAVKDADEVFLFVGRKNLCFHGRLEAGSHFQKDVYIRVGDIIPRYHERPCITNRIFVTAACKDISALGDWDIKARPAGDSVRTVFLAGDSTVADQIGEIPYHPGACYASWGQALPAFVGQGLAVDNQAHCGLSTETFREEGHFDIILRAIRPGDLCLFQFGHNDQKLSYLQPETGYRANLSRFIEEIRQKGAVPVLITPLGRNTWTDGGRKYLDLLEDYEAEVRRTGKEYGLGVIELHRYSVDFYLKHGFEACKSYFHPGDMTHTNEYGACLFASYVGGHLCQMFPESAPVYTEVEGMDPEPGLWEELRNKHSNRNLTHEQKEQFDALEKSQDNLIKIIEEARRIYLKCL